ncbi:tetratricopeptide repeat protein [Rhodococcus sp. NPDC058514]|uniref:tetratricopeptide repeat protein n=1 Tax=Rhodococcus sp. NPDC058514 TaxID=3346532 RepID=UPI003652AE6C
MRADLADREHVTIGSATLIAPRLALTAAHVVFDGASGRALTQVAAGYPGSATLSTARVRWPDRFHPGTGPADLDVALLEITDPAWQPPNLVPVRWGRLTGRSPGVPCEATGFPRVLRDPDGTRESQHISGAINPGTGLVSGRHDITVASGVPVTDPQDPHLSPWSGSSGAGVFCGGLLTAVLVIDTKGFGHQQLTSIPACRFIADDGVRAVLGEHGVPLRTESVELEQLLLTVEDETRVRQRRGARISPAMLLRADYEAVEFHGRAQLLANLTDWCTDSAAAVDVRLVVGPGGRGKTRLARRLVDMVAGRPESGDSDESRWVAGFLVSAASEPEVPLDRFAHTAEPVLVVVDYAETRTEQITELLNELYAGDGAPARVLLLARSAGDWWEGLARNLGGAVGESMELPPLDEAPRDRSRAFGMAVNAFAAQLSRIGADPGVNWAARAARAATGDLAEEQYGNPLALQLAALLWLLESDHAQPRSFGELEQFLLDQHEEKYWRTTAPGWLNLERTALAQAVTAATMCGARTAAEGRAVLAALTSLRGQPENALIAVADWLSDLYPASPGRVWGGLQPDRVGEHLAATTLVDDPGLLPAVLSSASDGQRYQALTVLARTMSNPAVRTAVRDALTAQLVGVLTTSQAGPELVAVVAQVATEAAGPGRLIDAVTAAVDDFTVAQLFRVAALLPKHSLLLADLAVEVGSALVAGLRGGAAGTPPNDYELAVALNHLAFRLSEVGRAAEALAAAEEAVALNRELAVADPAVRTRDLATSLNDLSAFLGAMGRLDEALSANEESLALYRGLDSFDLDINGPELAALLSSLGAGLAAVARPDEALTAIEESVALYREIAAAPDAHTMELARALNGRFQCLFVLGRREEALSAARESAECYRSLAATRPDAYTAEFARSLTDLSVGFSVLGRLDEALSVSEESVGLYRRLAAARPAVYAEGLALSLTNLSNALGRAGRTGAALAAIEESVGLYRGITGAMRDAATPPLPTP